MVALIARAIAALYPRRTQAEHRETRAFIAEAFRGEWRTRRFRGVWRVTTLLIADLLRCWTGRGALPVSYEHPLAGLLIVDQKRTTLMDRLIADLRYSLRVLARTPGFTAVAVVTLAVGIGAATAVYAVTDAVLLRPFPYPDMPRLALLFERSGGNGQQMSVSWHNYQDYLVQQNAFEELGIYRSSTVVLAGADQAERVSGATASSQVFSAMGIPPLKGRVFTAADDQASVDLIAVISERLWRSHFGARDSIIGEQALMNNRTFTIVGVMPASMRFPSRLTDVWLPIGLAVSSMPPRGAHPGLTAVGRLKPGVSFEQAQTSMSAIAGRLAAQYPDTNKGQDVIVSNYYTLVVQNIRPALMVLLGTVALLLLIACTNLASLMLARSDVRQREFALRAALGAGRGKLIRQLLVESSLLAAAGGAAGLGLAWLAVSVFIASEPTSVPRIDQAGIDWRVAMFALGLSVLTILLFGLLPALRASRPDLQHSLKDLRAGSSRRSVRLRRVLVGTQVAVAVVMLVGAGLLGKSLTRMMSIELGFNPDQVVTMRVVLPDAAYPSPDAWISFHRALLDRVASTAGVEHVGINSAVPLEGGGNESPVLKEGDPPPSAENMPQMCLFQAVGGQYFEAMGISVVRGRTFTAADMNSPTPVAVVDEALAAKLFGAGDPIGKRIAFEFDGHNPAMFKPLWREVIGVVRHVKHYGITSEPPYVQVYAPFTQLPIWMRDRRPAMALFARSRVDAEAIVANVRQAVRALDPGIPVYSVQTMKGYVGQRLEQPRLSATLVGGFAGVALLLAAVGLYGVLSYLVSLRTREIGVRLALGAGRATILRQVVGQGLSIALIGLAVGLAAAAAATRYLQSVLFDVSTTDVTTFAAAAGVLAAVAIVASAVPARRASGVDPLVALRAD